jgi:MEMO1 family protein
MNIRPPAVSGTFYRSDPTLLAMEVDRLLEEQQGAPLPGALLGLVVPHAGYAYSGSTAAAAYAQLRGRSFRTAVIVSPSHREYFNGLSIFDGDAYSTPLGIVEVDTSLRDALLEHRGAFMLSRFGHRDEHAIEVQLPFLQRVDDDLRIVPIVIGDQRREYCLLLGELLAQCAGDGVVLIASSDLSHFHEDREAKMLDRVAMDDLVASSATRLLDHLHDRKTEACGGGAVAAVLHAASHRGPIETRLLRYCTSGDVSGERSRVVGYVSAAILRREQDVDD